MLSSSCGGRKNYVDSKYETISINVNDLMAIDIRNNIEYNIKEIQLELTDNSLLSLIEQVEIYDDKIFIYDKGRLIVFDMDGVFSHEIGKKGGGPGEYTNINSFFIKENNVFAYDENLQKLFIYNIDGSFITSKKTIENISAMYPVNSKKFIGRKIYQGDRVTTPTLVILDENLELIDNISNRFLTSGIQIFDHCYSFNGNILYWEFLNDTIFSVEGTDIIPRYYVDFDEFKIPKREGKEISEIIEYINSNDSKFASGIRHIQEDISDIRFIFGFKENINYVKYNKQTKEISLCYFYDSKETLEVQYFMKYSNGKIILSIHDPKDVEGNPKLLFIDEKKLW
jgi:hypothetical protein